ncbi:MAG: hypothetical protein J6J23_06170 [Clostridia bacterium]|nr:hypothetical protein [Clostridia bacterium]
MKNIIIGGTVRSGKTTLANVLRERFGYSKVESDTIVNAFDKAFPEFGIRHKYAEKTRELYEPFLFEILNGFCKDLKYANNITVFPGSQFLPENLSRYEKLDKYIVIFLGLDNAQPEELLKVIRDYDTENDWTHKQTDEWLLRLCKNVIIESEKIKLACEKYGFYYFNTFRDRGLVLNQICDIIKDLQEGD